MVSGCQSDCWPIQNKKRPFDEERSGKFGNFLNFLCFE